MTTSNPQHDEAPSAWRRFASWLLDVKSDDPHVVRRARTHIRLASFFVVAPLIAIMLEFVGPFDPEFMAQRMAMRVLIALAHLGLIMLSRTGRSDLSGSLQMVLVTGFLLFSVLQGWMPPDYDIVYVLVIVLCGVSISPRYVGVITAIAIAASVYGHMSADSRMLGPHVLLFAMVGFVVFLQSRWFERAFDQTLKARDDAERLRAKAESANLAKSRFLAAMSHELRTPLNAIIGYSELLEEELEELEHERAAASMRGDTHRIKNSGRHLLTMIDEVLDLAKIEEGRLSVHAETLEVEQFVEDLAAEITPLVDADGNTLIVEVRASIASIETDPTRLRQILVNLLSNATKFTEAGTITLRVTDGEDGELRFDVSDTGIGMTEAQLERIFEAFEQADSEINPIYGGAGLGLTLARRIAALLDGRLLAESEPGNGSTFSLFVPAG